MHVTVAYCDGELERAKGAVQSVAESTPMLSGRTTGIGTFAPSMSSDGKTVLWLRPEVPGLVDLHTKVLEALDLVGVKQRTVREYQPHITLACVDADAELALPLIEPQPLYFHKLIVRQGDTEHEFYLNGGPGVMASSGGY